MALVEKQIKVAVPLRTAYNQRTQFELFPRFMEGVESVNRSLTADCIGERRLVAG